MTNRASEPDPPAERPDDRRAADHRNRLTGALESLLAEKAFQEINVGDIVARARTSRRDFYAHFDSKNACLIALFKEVSDTGAAYINAAVDRTAAWQTQLRQLITAGFGFVDARPAVVLSFIRDLPLLGAATRDFLNQDTDIYAETFRQIYSSEEFRRAGGTPMSRDRVLMLIGGLERLATDTVCNGDKLSAHTEEAVQVALLLAAPHSSH
ncbi:TetR/AcrR family transcriptional regulator [Catenulispora yoronensis]|uniref:TetR/AcrR family transcriptional regulator n=1 Tax=Catenulispora yoronensis TaxID=450799 RepID=A0ABP5GRN8_9ACTN